MPIPPGPRVTARTLVVQPLGPFTPEARELLRQAAAFASVYFQRKVRIEPGAPLPRKGRRQRRTPDGRTWWQYETRWIFQGQLSPRLPEDAVAFLGVTTEDLYPGPDWNYVFGEALLEDRVGVYSLARYFPSFWGEADTAESRRRTRLRTFKVLAHETAHMFGLHHCQEYQCVVNGSNSLEEADRQPLHLCPLCLKKLHWNLRFDPAARYRALARFYRKHDLEAEAAFVEARLEKARGTGAGTWTALVCDALLRGIIRAPRGRWSALRLLHVFSKYASVGAPCQRPRCIPDNILKSASHH